MQTMPHTVHWTHKLMEFCFCKIFPIIFKVTIVKELGSTTEIYTASGSRVYALYSHPVSQSEASLDFYDGHDRRQRAPDLWGGRGKLLCKTYTEANDWWLTFLLQTLTFELFSSDVSSQKSSDQVCRGVFFFI